MRQPNSPYTVNRWICGRIRTSVRDILTLSRTGGILREMSHCPFNRSAICDIDIFSTGRSIVDSTGIETQYIKRRMLMCPTRLKCATSRDYNLGSVLVSANQPRPPYAKIMRKTFKRAIDI